MAFFRNLDNFSLLCQRCDCGKVNILGFPNQLKWERNGDLAITTGVCEHCGKAFARKEVIFTDSECGHEDCPEKDCKACYDTILAGTE